MFRPTQFDHNDALAACAKIRDAGKTSEMDSEICVLNAVAGAWACNEQAYTNRRDFEAAIAKANSIGRQ